MFLYSPLWRWDFQVLIECCHDEWNPVFSYLYENRFTNHLFLHFGNGFLCQDAIRLQCHHDGLLQIRFGLFKSFPLCIRAGQFFNEPNVALGHFLNTALNFMQETFRRVASVRAAHDRARSIFFLFRRPLAAAFPVRADVREGLFLRALPGIRVAPGDHDDIAEVETAYA